MMWMRVTEWERDEQEGSTGVLYTEDLVVQQKPTIIIESKKSLPCCQVNPMMA